LNASQNYCQYCGAALSPGKRFCEQCGAAVPSDPEAPPAGWQGQPSSPPSQAPAPQPYSPPPPGPVPAAPPPSYAPVRQPYPVPPPVQKKRGSPCLIIGLVLLVLVVCIGIVAVVGYIIVQGIGPASTGIATAVVGAMPTQAVLLSTPAPADPVTSQSANESQYLNDHSIYDDFSSSTLGWKEGSSDIGAWGYADGGYFINVAQPEYMVWKFPPVNFQPTTAEFDVWSPSGPQGGTYGVICHFQDQDNFYFVEIDQAGNSYSFGQYAAGEQIILSNPEWKTATFLKTNSQDANHIMVGCDSDMLSLFINNQYEEQVVLNEYAQPGDLAIFVSTWNDLGPQGFKVIFDNFSAWLPVQ
jgi:hypothetical protein